MAKSSTGKAPRAEWLLDTSRKFVAALRKEKDDGRMVENGFKAVAWTNAAAVLRTDLGISFTVPQLKNQWARLRRQYKLLVELRQQSGFGWDGERFMVTATENVWQALLEKHTKFIWFRHHPFPLFDDLTALCENTFATGEYAFSIGGALEPSTRDAGEDAEDSEDLEDGANVDPTEGNVVVPATQQTSGSISSVPAVASVTDEAEWRSATFPKPPSKRQRASPLTPIASSLDRIADALQPSSGSATGTNPSTPRRKRAWAVAMAEETDLSSEEMAKIQRIWRYKPELAEEYLSFTPRLRSARDIWLQNEFRAIE